MAQTRRFVRTGLLTAALLAAIPVAAAAQATWVGGWGGFLMDPGTVVDPGTDRRWEFGTSFKAGVLAQRDFGGFTAGVELGYSPVRHEVWDLDRTALEADGRAHIVTAMATARLGAAGAAGFGSYLAGAIGTMIYGIPSLDVWDPDLALRGGGGVEYRHRPNLALFVEWTRWWALHQSEGVQDNTVRHGTLVLGARYRL